MPQQAVLSISPAPTLVLEGMGGKAGKIVMHVLIHDPWESSAVVRWGGPESEAAGRGPTRTAGKATASPAHPEFSWSVLPPVCTAACHQRPMAITLQIMCYAKKHAFVCYKAIVLQISACKIEKPPSLCGDDALWSHFGPVLLPAPGPKAPTSAPSLLSKASEETRRPSLSPQPPF